MHKHKQQMTRIMIWQLYLMLLPEQDLRNFRLLDFYWIFVNMQPDNIVIVVRKRRCTTKMW